MAILILDLVGTFVFALSGATAGVMRQLDLFGVLVLAFASAASGGILRDLLISAVPPAAIADWRYLAVSIVAGVVTFYWSKLIGRAQSVLLILDAIGLSLFAIAGADKALAFHLHPVMAIVMGMVTGIGGGIARDVLLSEIPLVLRADLYAVAALAGAAVFVCGRSIDAPSAVTVTSGVVVCFGLRFMAIRFGWRLPTAIISNSRDIPSE